ncbi:hypothetical protein [Candidatus Villigracilis affinis]|uniref:hypothetical protein n=1 Tax=Candidatus Villigracilis affinis TaxID=3140682 RepID=UPI002A1DAE09|nr:hypothetical protein [Anaerolineales bacterium]
MADSSPYFGIEIAETDSRKPFNTSARTTTSGVMVIMAAVAGKCPNPNKIAAGYSQSATRQSLVCRQRYGKQIYPAKPAETSETGAVKLLR